jgi:hypothetical protein
MWRKLHSEELHQILVTENVLGKVLLSSVEGINRCVRVLVGRSGCGKELGRAKRRVEHNIKV